MTPRKDAVAPKKEPKEPKPPPKEPDPFEPKKPDPPKEPEKEPEKEPPGNARTIKLPAPVEANGGIAYGGAGRFVLLSMPTRKELAVFDATRGEVVKTLPTANAELVIAAGRNHFFVVNNEDGMLQRWSLTTFVREETVKLPAGGPFSYRVHRLELGRPSALVSEGGTVRADQAAVGRCGDAPRGAGFGKAGRCGAVFGTGVGRRANVHVGTEAAGRGAVVATVADGKVRWQKYPEVANPLLPDPSGRFFYASSGVYDNRFNRIRAATGALAPAAQGNLYLDVDTIGGPPSVKRVPVLNRASVFVEGQFEPFATIDNLSKPSVTGTRVLHLVPRHGVLVTLSTAADELVLHPFDLDAALARSGVGSSDRVVGRADSAGGGCAVRVRAGGEVEEGRGGVQARQRSGGDACGRRAVGVGRSGGVRRVGRCRCRSRCRFRGEGPADISADGCSRAEGAVAVVRLAALA